jgi:hypothetical protein
MAMHLFVINARPTLAADPNGRLGGAIVHVWVIENDPMLAEESALRQITEYDWVVEDIAYHFEPTTLQIAQLGEKERRNYEKAKTYGVSAEFIAWAKDESSFEELFRGPRAPKIFPVSDRKWRKQQADSSRFQAAVRRRFAESTAYTRPPQPESVVAESSERILFRDRRCSGLPEPVTCTACQQICVYSTDPEATPTRPLLRPKRPVSRRRRANASCSPIGLSFVRHT